MRIPALRLCYRLFTVAGMAMLRKLALLIVSLSVITCSLHAATRAETHEFSTATQAYEDKIWWHAESLFAQFVEKYPKSEHRPQAMLYQAICRFYQTNALGASDLLLAGLDQAGTLADEYQYWIAESYFRAGNFPAAADAYTELRRRYAASKRKLDAYVGEAASRARLNQWTQIVTLLGEPNGEFARAASASSTNEIIARGLLVLGEAQLAQNNYAAVDAALAPLRAMTNGDFGWRAEYLRCEAQRRVGHLPEALSTSSNLVAMTAAMTDGKDAFMAESIALQGAIFEQMGQPDKAQASFEQNFGPTVPIERQRQALLKTTEFSIARGNLAGATNSLIKFLNQFSNSPASDVALLSLGEIYLKQHVTSVAAARSDTNSLDTALGYFDRLLRDHTNSVYAGKAELDRGWCFWIRNQMSDSAMAFERAAKRLGDNEDRAVARFKLGDAFFELKNYPQALEQYRLAAESFPRWPQARDELGESVYYQMLRVSLALTNEAVASEAMEKILKLPARDGVGEESRLLLVQGFADVRNAQRAQAEGESFIKLVPNSPLRPEVELVIGRAREQQGDWTGAMAGYSQWLEHFPTNALRTRAEFQLALANAKAGNETNALMRFTNFVARYSSDALAPQAQWWVADYFYRHDESGLQEAEKNYKLLFQNWPTSSLAFDARMMAGRAAYGGQRYSDAIEHFTKLGDDLKCPVPLRAQAAFARGDALMSLPGPETNKWANFNEAVRVFGAIPNTFPNEPVAILAWGEMGKCWKQLPGGSSNAVYAFSLVIDSTNASISARSEAQVMIASVWVDLAHVDVVPRVATDEQKILMRRALASLLDVVYGENVKEGETRDLFWVKKAALDAAPLLETMGDIEQMERLYTRMKDVLPTLAPMWQRKIEQARERRLAEKNQPRI